MEDVGFLLLLVLNIAEDVIAGLINNKPIADSLAEMGGGTPDQLLATILIMFLIFLPFFAFRVLGEAIGERNLVRVFFHPRGKF